MPMRKGNSAVLRCGPICRAWQIEPTPVPNIKMPNSKFRVQGKFRHRRCDIITAIEKIRTRYYKLLANLEKQGAGNVKVLLLDSIWVRKKFPEYFDKILADVPCSAEGRFLVSDPKTFKYWKQRKVKEMMHKQKKLLHAAWLALSVGGTLVYSTCTLSPEENEGIVNWLLDKFKGGIEMSPIRIPLKNSREGFIRFDGKRFSESLRLSRRIIPDGTMEGFFVAKIKKTSY